MSKHTPGPWFRYTREGQMGIVAGEVVEKECATPGGTKTIESYEFDVVGGCSCCGSPYGVNDHDTAEANARLIAAAPELLDALNGLLTLHENVDFTCDGDWNAARAAVAKATGGAT